MAKMYNTRRQVDPTDFPINPATTSGVDLADILNRLYFTVMSNNAGIDRPLNIDRGGIWSQYDEVGNITLWMFDGSADIQMGSLTDGVFTPVGSDGLQSQVSSLDTRVTNIEVSLGTSLGIPRGVITMWSGLVTNVPAGWVLCDGTNETPDLRDKFIVGAGNSYNTQTEGGSTTKTIGINNMPNHNHGGGGSGDTGAGNAQIQDGGHSHTFYQGTANQSGESTPCYSPVGSNGSGEQGTNLATTGVYDSGHTHPVTVTINAEGGGEPLDILPPFFALAYIMKT